MKQKKVPRAQEWKVHRRKTKKGSPKPWEAEKEGKSWAACKKGLQFRAKKDRKGRPGQRGQ